MKPATALICFMTQFRRTITPKVLANFSPGLSFGNPGDKDGDCFCRNPEGIATVLHAADATLSGLTGSHQMTFVTPGLPKLNPGDKDG
jgi:hypothetical protein